MVIKRFDIDKWEGHGAKFPEYKGPDRGAGGKVKKGKWNQITIRIMNQSFNKGSMIDALNRNLGEGKKIKKGLRGASDKKVTDEFMKQYSEGKIGKLVPYKK